MNSYEREVASCGKLSSVEAERCYGRQLGSLNKAVIAVESSYLKRIDEAPRPGQIGYPTKEEAAVWRARFEESQAAWRKYVDLDCSIVGQFDFYGGNAGGRVEQRCRIARHLERLRQIERRADD